MRWFISFIIPLQTAHQYKLAEKKEKKKKSSYIFAFFCMKFGPAHSNNFLGFYKYEPILVWFS